MASIAKAMTPLSRQLRRFFYDTVTEDFLRARNAKLTIQETGSQSFYVVRVQPKTSIGTKEATLYFQIKLLSNQTLSISVYNRTTKQTLVTLTVPFSSAGGAMNLDLDGVHLKMDLDADPS